jgi:RecA-family ATPase
MTAFEFKPIKFQLDGEQCETLDFTEFQSLVFNAGDAILSAPVDAPRRFILMEFSGPAATEGLEMLGKEHAGFAWMAGDRYCAVVMLSHDTHPDECQIRRQAAQKAIARFLEVTFNDCASLPTPTKDTPIHPLNGDPIATSGVVTSVSALDLQKIDRRALAAFIDKLKTDRDLWTLQRGNFPLGAEQTKRGHDEAFARVLHRHGAKPEWIAALVSANDQYGLEARHGDIKYLNEIVREVCASPVEDSGEPLCESMSSFMDGREPQQVLVEGILYKGDHNAAMGHPNAGKTSGILDIALRVALGMAFGKHEVARDRVIYIAGEDPDGIRRRVKLWCQSRGLETEVLDDWFFIVRRPVLDNPTDVARLKAEMRTVRPGLMVTDTFSANFGGESEDKATEVKKWMKMIREDFIVEFACCAVTLHHPPKGATDIHNWRGSGMAAGDLDNVFCFRNLGDDHICMDQADGRAKHRTARFSQIIWTTETASIVGWVNNLGKPETSVRVTLDEDYKVESSAKVCRAIQALIENGGKTSHNAIADLADVPRGSMSSLMEKLKTKGGLPNYPNKTLVSQKSDGSFRLTKYGIGAAGMAQVDSAMTRRIEALKAARGDSEDDDENE